jgi:hypothetical protein
LEVVSPVGKVRMALVLLLSAVVAIDELGSSLKVLVRAESAVRLRVLVIESLVTTILLSTTVVVSLQTDVPARG